MDISALSAKLGEILTPYMDLGALFMIFLVFTLIGLVIGLGILNAIRNGLMVAVGFNGVYIVVDFFVAAITPAATILSEKFGGVFEITDVGWGAMAAVAWSNPIAYAVVIFSVILNLVLVFANLTDTINLNIWDLWEANFCAVIVLALGGNAITALVVALCWSVISLYLADWYGHMGYSDKFYGFQNITLYQGVNDIWGPFGWVMAKILDKIPGLKSAKFTPEYIQDKFGVIGEPAVLGGLIGIFMGVLAGLWWADIVMLMINISTGLVVIPMMSGIVMQALVPVSEKASEILQKKTGGRNLFIGVDCAIAVGHSAVLATTTLMIPLMIVFAFIIPGARMMPLADLPSLLFFWVYIVAPCGGDIVRCLIACIVAGLIVTVLLLKVAPYGAAASALQGVGGGKVASTFLGFCPDMWVTGMLQEHFSDGGVIAVMIIITLACTALSFIAKKNRKKNIAAAAAE
jgi:PTS system galactitol-specific IIC component